MARQISPAMRERANHVGNYIRAHKGEASMAELMRRAQASFGSRGGGDSMPERSNPSGGKKVLLVVGALAVGALFLRKVEASKPQPVNPYNYPLYPTGPQVPSTATGTNTVGF